MGWLFVVSTGVSFLCVAGYLLIIGHLAGRARVRPQPLTQTEKARLDADITNAISAYDATTGAPINPTLVDNKVINMEGMAVVGDRLYVAALDRRVRVYDKTRGTKVSGGFACAFPAPATLALVGDHFLIPDYVGGVIAAYDVRTGRPLDTVGIKGIPQAQDIVLSDGALYVLSRNGTVGKYDAAMLAVINPALVLGLVEPSSLAVAHDTVYISTHANNTVATYDARTGRHLNPSLIGGLTSPWSLAISGNTPYVMQHR